MTSASPPSASTPAAAPAPGGVPAGLIETHERIQERFGRPPDVDGIVGAFRRFRPPAWTTGTISAFDAAFLHDLVTAARPARIVEVGVASGCSSAAMLAALASAGLPLTDDRGVPTLHGFDRLDACFFDRERPLAGAVEEMVPGLASGLALHPRCTAVDAARRFAGEPLTFAFIDADHRHPHPTADLLALAPALAPGAWVALHDINLVAVAEAYEARTGEAVDWRHRGAEFLFDTWPFERLRGEGGARNIGAIRMPTDRPLALDDVRAIVDRRWEDDAVPADVARRLGRAAAGGVGGRS